MTAALRTTVSRYGGAVWVLVCAIAVALFLLYARVPATSSDRSTPDAAQVENGPVVVPRSHAVIVPGVHAITGTKRGTFALTGVAANATTGKTLAGAQVTLTSGGRALHARTNALGAWSFVNVAPGAGGWTIRVAAPGYGVFVETNSTFLPNTAYEMTAAVAPKTRR